MLSHEQYEMARRHTRETIEDEQINRELLELTKEKKLLVSDEAWSNYRKKGRLSIHDIKKISSKHSLSLSSIYCIFKERQDEEKILFKKHIGVSSSRYNGY